MNTDRMVIQAVQELYRTGELYFGFLEFRTGTYAMWDAVPNAHFFDTYGTIIYELAERSWADGGGIGNRAYSFYSAGYENFLKDGVRFFYRRGQRDKAEQILNRYFTWEGRNKNMSVEQREAEARTTLDEWITTQYTTQRWSSPYVAQSDIAGALQGAFAALLAGDRAMFQSQFDFAAQFHAKYFEVQPRREVTATGDGVLRMDQVEPDFRFLAGSAFARFMAMIDLEYAERVYDLAPDDLRRFAYDFLQDNYRQGLEQVRDRMQGRAFDEMFPQPSGMPEFRRWLTDFMQRRTQQGRQVEQR